MNAYKVKFLIDDELCVRGFNAINAGQAFQRCLRKHPKARLIEAWREGGYLYGYGITIYKPPSTVKVEAAEAPKQEQMKFDLS